MPQKMHNYLKIKQFNLKYPMEQIGNHKGNKKVFTWIKMTYINICMMQLKMSLVENV